MNDSNDLFEGNEHPIRNRDAPVQFVVALQTMRHLWTEYALDDFVVGLLFAHQHQPSLFSLCSHSSFHSIIFNGTGVLPSLSQQP